MKKELFFVSMFVILLSIHSVLLSQDEAVESTSEPVMSEAELQEKRAVDRFWTILEKNPRRGTAFDRVYGYHVDTGQMDQLFEHCLSLTEQSPGDAKAWLLLGLVLSRRSDDQETIKAYQKAESLDPDDAMSSFYLGEAYIAQGRLKEASEALERALERKPSRNDILPVLQTLGRVYERFGDKEKSDGVWRMMEELFPNDLDILVRIAETLEEENKFDEALLRYQKLAELAQNDNYSRVRFTLSAADIKIRLGNKQEAINDFEKLLEELAGNHWLADSVRDRVERVFVRQADYAGLAGYYEKRLNQHPNDLETVRRLAVALVRLARTDEAKKLLEATLVRAPSDITLRLALIDLLVNDKEFDAIDTEYAKINELDPNNPDYLSQWGLAILENRKLSEAERKAKAVAVWMKLVDARPSDPAMIVMVADLMAGGKINDEAEKLYLRATELVPNDPSYREYLGYFYHRTEQREKAIETLAQIAAGNRKTARNLYQLGSIYQGLGYTEEALAAIRDAVALAPNDLELTLHYGNLLLENHDFETAELCLETAKKLVETDEEFKACTQLEIKVLAASDKLDAVMEQLQQAEQGTSRDWWRLAVMQQSDGNLEQATATIEKALEHDAESLLVLDTAADIYAKGYDQEKAAEICEKLAQIDSARRVDHLKRLANLQREIGQTDKALETAKLVMATGAGNAANSRFYADMLLSIGRRRDGIETLRRAVRIDPTDQVTLSALADQLAASDQFEEAIEILWRIHARTEDLQGKMGVVGKLSNYYQMAQRFDQLIERLRQNANDTVGRREAAYCLAQAHASVGDYFAARNALEMLLTNVDEEKTSDTFLLNQLSRVVEMQGDLGAAIRYQEMLCDLSSLTQDFDRLLSLYYANGEQEKAATLYLKTVSEKADFADQIEAIDKMLAMEDYVTAKTLLARLEMKYHENWELLYRKLQLQYWLKEGDPETSIADIRRLTLDPEELSAKKQKERDAANLKKTTHIEGQNRRVYSVGTNYSPWGFGQHHGYNVYHHANNSATMMSWSSQNQEILQTVFREQFRLEQHYYHRGSFGSKRPEKPIFKPENFGDMQFAAEVWEMKFALEQAREEWQKEHPETEEPSEEAEPSGPKLERLATLITQKLARLPEDSDDKNKLLARARILNFLQQWETADSTIQLPPNLTGDQSLDLRQSLKRVTIRLGRRGEKEWHAAALPPVISDLNVYYANKHISTLDMDAILAKRFPDEQQRKKSLEVYAAVQESLQKIENDPFTIDQKRAWVAETLVSLLEETSGSLLGLIDTEFKLFLRNYELLGMKEDKQLFMDAIEKAGKQEPAVFYQMASLEWITNLLIGPDPIGIDVLFGEDPGDLLFERSRSWIIKGTDAAMANLNKSGSKQTQTPFPGTIISDVHQSQMACQSLIVCGTLPFVDLFGWEAVRDASQNAFISSPRMSMGGYAGGVPMVWSHLSIDESEERDDEEEKIIVATDDLAKLQKGTQRLFEIVDFYFENYEKLMAAQESAVKTPVRHLTQRQQMQTFSQYRYYFDGHNQLGEYEIQMLLNSGQPAVPHNEMLFHYRQTFVAMDHLMSRVTPGEGVSRDDLQFKLCDRFMKIIEEKAASDDKHAASLAKSFQTQMSHLQDQQQAQAGEEMSQETSTLRQLSAEFEESRKPDAPPMATTKLFLLAILYSQSEKNEQAITVLDEIPFTAASDTKLRETIVLQLYHRSEQTDKLKERAQTAINRLLGYQLSTEELKTLRVALRQFDRNEEADAIRDRLLVTANDLNTMYELLQELRGAGEEKKDQAVQYALKVFRSPAVSGVQAMRNDSYARHVKSEALDVLKNAGKLEEIIEQIEAQWKSSPGSFEIMASLADIYNRAGRTDDAKKIMETLGKTIPEDAQKMLSYAVILREMEMKDEAVDWTTKALKKEPNLFFNNYWEYQRIYRDTQQEEKLLDFLDELDVSFILQHGYQFGYVLQDLMNDEQIKEKASALFEKFWTAEGGNDQERETIQQTIIESMIHNTTPEFYPYFKQVVFRAMSIPPERKKSSPSSPISPVSSSHNPHQVRSWSSDKAYSLSQSLLEIAKDTERLEELTEELNGIIASHLEIAEDKRDWHRYTQAKIFEIMLESKKGHSDKAMILTRELLDVKKAEPVLNDSALILLQAMENADDKESIDLALVLLERAAKQNRGSGSFVDSFLLRKRILLYLKSDQPEKGCELGIASLRKNIRLLKLCGTNHHVQVGNQYYDIHSLSESIQQIGNAMKNADCGMEMLLLYRTECEGKPWFETLMKNSNMRYYTQRIREPFDGISENITVENFVKFIDLFLPPLQTRESEEIIVVDETSEDQPATARVPLELGVYFSPKLTSVNTEVRLITSKMQRALQRIAKDDPEKYTQIGQSLAQLEKDHPDEPTVLLVNLFYHLATDDIDMTARSMETFIKWIASGEKTNLADQVYIATWTAAREIYMDPQKYDAARFQNPCEKMTLFAVQFVGKSLEGQNVSQRNPGLQGKGNALLQDIQHFAAPSMEKKIKVTVSQKSLSDMLLEGGQISPNISQEYSGIHEHFLSVVRAGNVETLLGVFEDLFAGGMKKIVSSSTPGANYTNPVRMAHLLESVLLEAEKTGVDPNLVYESLLKIVVRETSVFTLLPVDPGGLNGRFCSPAFMLIDWSFKAGRDEELLQLLHAKRETLAPADLEVIDAMEYAIALRTGNAERAAELNRKFLEILRQEEPRETGLRVAFYTLAAIDTQPLTRDQLELFDAALARNCENGFASPVRFNRFAYYLIRKHWFDTLEMSDDVSMATRRLTWYRQIAVKASQQTHPFRGSHKLAPPIFQQPDGLRRVMEDRLCDEGEKSLRQNDLQTAVAVLRYFAEEPVSSQYYRDLGKYIDLLAEKTADLDDAMKQEQLGNLLTTTARSGNVALDIEAGKPCLAEDHDLPQLPEGTGVYENDFETDAGNNWSHTIRAVTPTGKRSYLGAFNNNDVTFTLDDIPEHQFLRIRFDLFVIGVPEGVMGGGNGFGPDTWEMTIDDHLKPIGTTFANFRQEEYSHKQSYPDDFPLLFGRPISWEQRIPEEDFWSDDLEMGYYLAREGAVEEKSLGYFRDAVYAIDIIVPHDQKNLKIDFRTLFTDDPLEVGHLADFLEESWGIDNFRVNIVGEPWDATDEQLQRCFDALIGTDGKKANAARWRLVAAGDRTVDWLERWAVRPENAAKLKEIIAPGSFSGFRFFRVLQLIDTPQAKASPLYAESEKPISGSLMDKIKITVSAASLKSSLFPSGVLVENLEYCYYDIMDQYVAAVQIGNTENVLSVFRDIFKNGWPGLGSPDQTNMDYRQAVLVLRILDAVLDAAAENNVDPDIVVDALLEIVLPKDKKNIFWGIYDELGGVSGYYRSPAVSLVQWANKAKRGDDIAQCIENRAKINQEENHVLTAMHIGGLALVQGLEFPNNAEAISVWCPKFMTWINEEQSAIAGRIALASIAGYGIRPDTVELFDASLELCRQGPIYSRFACHVIRENWNDLFETGHIKSAIHWLEVYRRIVRDTNNARKQDAFRFMAENRLYEYGENALDENNLESAIAILRYFAQENVDSFRYRDLGTYLDRLNEKCASLNDTAKLELFGDWDLSKIARTGTVPFNAEAAKPKIAETFGLTELPSGTVVYEHDFQTEPGEHWSTQKRDITAKGKRPYLGEFVNEPVTFKLDDLPEHEYLRIRFDLFMLEGLDGLVGYGSRFGVDSWEMTVDGNAKPIASTFSNFRKDNYNQKQSYPDDYPPLLGITHSWQHRVESEDVWGDDLETGLHYGREGSVEHNALTYNMSAVYPVDLVIPHEKAELLIAFSDRFIDGPYELDIYHQSYGECWGIANFRIETLEKGWDATEEELDACVAALLETDSKKANAARWRLVAAGRKTVDALAKWVDLPDNASKLKEIRSPGNFYGFRLMRVLELIGSPEAKQVKEKIFE